MLKSMVTDHPLVDLHQHAWSAPLLDALRARRSLPFIRRSAEGLTVLHSLGERPFVLGGEDLLTDVGARRERLGGADRAVVALSSPIGIEALATGEARELISAHLEGVSALGPEFEAWGPLALSDPDPGQVDGLLGRGCAGISVAAGGMGTREELDRLLPALERASERDAVLFVHPGPGPGSLRPEPGLTEPLWWPALTGYVESVQRAWLTFATYGRRQLPDLRIVFSLLAGGAPLLAERLVTRGGPDIDRTDPLTFYDTSSYGPAMVETMARWVGSGQLVYGSDRPILEPLPTGREFELMSRAGQLLSATPVAL